MRGGIQKKGNNYYAVVYDGIDPGTGRKRRRWVPAGTRRADACWRLSCLHMQRQRCLPIERQGPVVIMG